MFLKPAYIPNKKYRLFCAINAFFCSKLFVTVYTSYSAIAYNFVLDVNVFVVLGLVLVIKFSTMLTHNFIKV